ncbi:6-carboxytetrahydropterin synthase [Shewanella corallii]|uniref:6-carboxy-5,6,7,8-tetrahydropterin synthase n=1 Tax=Shewanella corallii TaxID=560080 RepID=A0ABT0N7A6_9GAMM|nr:6-carboxytetrahydropterin synthase [Shewanella corallii]MCL2914267.1 6-carboxytetrahydropterin synthase [Shewanella corallii]
MQLFVNDLTVIDFSYLCPIRGMVGESWIVDVLLDGGLDDQNMVLDFAKVKRSIKHTIDEVCDHRLLVPVLNDAVSLESQDEMVRLDFDSRVGSMHMYCPEQAFALIDTPTIDFDSVNRFLIDALTHVLPGNVEHISLTLRNEQLETPYYHYSHGLKKHDGNCQRIAHGHRSPIKIFRDSAPAPELEATWAKRWQDIYLGTAEDQAELESLNLSAGLNISADSHWGFDYTAPQGRFQLAIPRAVTEMIPHDTTVELLAGYISGELAKAEPGVEFKVIAYEGVGKGAIASAKVAVAD